MFAIDPESIGGLVVGLARYDVFLVLVALGCLVYLQTGLGLAQFCIYEGVGAQRCVP